LYGANSSRIGTPKWSAPESQHIFYRLSREIRGDGERCGRRVIDSVLAIEQGEADPGQTDVRSAGLVEDPNVADKTAAIAATLRRQDGVTP